jgi:hypothetical protein
MKELMLTTMKPIDKYLSEIERTRLPLDEGEIDYLLEHFTSLVGPVLGAEEAEEFFQRMLARVDVNDSESLLRFGYAAAFFIDDYDDSMQLTDEDWDDIRETVNEGSHDIHIDILTALMNDLLERGKL